MILEPAKSNIINMNGGVVTPAVLVFCDGFGHALGQKVKLVNLGMPLRSPLEQKFREQTFEWYGI